MFVSATLFIGGSMAGFAVAEFLAEDSWISGILGFFMFPLAFITGMLLWQGVAILTGFFKWIFRKDTDQTSKGKVPPGSFMLIPPAILLPGLAGVGMGFVSGEAWMWSASLICGGAGLIYGLVLFIAAKLKLLPMIDK